MAACRWSARPRHTGAFRDYGTASWSGGDPGCDHRPPDEAGQTNKPTMGQREHAGRFSGANCWRCGATRQDNQIGLERSPIEYVTAICDVLAEVWRVLRDDGTVWLNLGDSYARIGGDSTQCGPNATVGNTLTGVGKRMGRLPEIVGRGSRQETPQTNAHGPSNTDHITLKPKDLVGIPWRVAFALQAEGWYLRSDIVWSKPNPMPESVTDRCTKAHEYIFMLTKRQSYYFDAEAIKEAASENTHARGSGIGKKNASTEFGLGIKYNQDYAAAINGIVSERNKRSVWHVATQPYPEAHFATFPEALIEPCILAGTSERGQCPECGKPWERVTEHGEILSTGGSKTGARATNMHTVSPLGQDPTRSAYNTGEFIQRAKITTGWQPTCTCIAGEPIPQTVLDPFCGSGTTGVVACRHNRNFIGIELNPKYAELAERRIVGDAALLNQVEVVAGEMKESA